MPTTATLIFGGTFDPPHAAHVILPMLVKEAVRANSVTYVPAGVSPFKIGRPGTPAEHRLAMTRLALDNVGWARVSSIEAEHAAGKPRSPTYTVDTLEALRAERPGHPMRLLIGADQLRMFDKWMAWQRVIELAEPVVMLRPPGDRKTLLAGLPHGFDPIEWEPRIVPIPLIDISSTQVRERVADGRPITAMVAPAVERYIAEQQLYRRQNLHEPRS